MALEQIAVILLMSAIGPISRQIIVRRNNPGNHAFFKSPPVLHYKDQFY